MRDLVIFYPDGHQKHSRRGHPERPERVKRIKTALKETGIWQSSDHVRPIPEQHIPLDNVHEPAYLDRLQEFSSKGEDLDLDTYTTVESWPLAVASAGGAAAAARTVWEGEETAGVALTRPPGHHAEVDRAMGFCLLNNAALAAEYIIQSSQLENVMILDLDVHHGNGTQQIFYRRPDVSYFSIHQSPFYPGTGLITERGAGSGEGTNLNVPLPPGSGDQAYRSITERILIPFLNQIKPEFLMVSFGYDIHWRDPLGGMLVSAETVFWIFQELTNWAHGNCQNNIMLVLEGGYDLLAGEACLTAAASALKGDQWEDRLGPSPDPERSGWEKVISRIEDSL